MYRIKKYLVLLAVLSLAALIGVSAVGAQDGITVSVAMPEFYRDLLGENAFDQFEAENPGVSVNVVYTGFDSMFVTPAASSLDDHLDSVAEYVSKADVVSVSSSTMSIESTRAGYFLDLSPLANADTALNVDDFIPAAWQSFQWDGGTWALPSSLDTIIIAYDAAAFDAVGLAYPNDAWTLTEFANAARALTQYDENGTVSLPGLVTFENSVFLFRTLLGQGFYDSAAFPDRPSFDDNAALESLLIEWLELEDEGVVSTMFSGDIMSSPLRIFGSFGLGGGFPGGQDNASSAALLPGGTAGIDPQGFAVSGGTLYPNQAYALAKYLTTLPGLASGPFGVSPARRSLIGVEVENNGGPSGFGRVNRSLTPENQAVIDRALEAGLPLAELRYVDYVMTALDAVRAEGVDVRSALQSAEARAVANLQTAADRHSTTTVYVATPVPEVVLQAGEIELNFGMQSFIQPVPNSEQWQQLIRDFVAADPQVGQINMNIGRGNNFAEYAAQYDCFYLSYNAVPSLDQSMALNLDPYIDIDATFDRSDVVGNALSLVQRDGKIWALPVVVQPQVLSYHSQLFAAAGIPAPEGSWTVDQFVDALRALKTADPTSIPFVSRSPGGNYLLQLIAAFGGIPFDNRTNPPTINLTDANNVAAIQQVLDLAKEGYIDYQQLASSRFMIAINDETTDAIYTEGLTGFGRRLIFEQNTAAEGEDPYRMTTYPRGTQYSAVSYDIGTAYISAASQNADACYRWLSEVARHPELFGGMPARRTLINDPAYAASEGADAVALYNQFDALMGDPNTINFQSPFSGDTSPGNFILQYWMNRAFDRYVLEDADLAAELAEAQQYVTLYQECVAAIPPFDAAVQDRPAYNQQFTGCASTIDPTVTDLFAGPG